MEEWLASNIPPEEAKVDRVVTQELAGMRLDRALAHLVQDLSRSRARVVTEEGRVFLDGERITDPRYSVVAGQNLTASYILPQDPLMPLPQLMDLDIIDERDEFLVLNKPPGLVMHPGSGHCDGTLANGLVAHSEGAALLPRGGLVHRLDKDTSGLVVVAKNSFARLNLLVQFKERTVKRNYLAIVHGQPAPTGVIDRPIGRDAANRVKMAVTEGGRPAVTRWRIVQAGKAYSLMICQLESGRTHQIRVHMECLRHPVAGDRAYCRHARAEGGMFPRQMLHAFKLAFNHPGSGEPLEYECAPPKDFLAVLQALNFKAEHA